MGKNYCNQYTLISFHPEMNCIIGGRGTGKSTILQIILHILKFGTDEEFDHIKDRFSEAIIYIRYKGQNYAIYYNFKLEIDSYVNGQYKNASKFKIYIQKGNNGYKFQLADVAEKSALLLFIGTGYMQGDLSKFQRDPNNILSIVEEFLKWKKNKEYKKNQLMISANIGKIKEIMVEYEDKRDVKDLKTFLIDEDYLQEIILYHNIISKAKDNEFILYKNMIDELNGLLRGKVKLHLKKGIKNDSREALLKYFPQEIIREKGKYYAYQVKVRKLLERVIEFISVKSQFDFFILLFDRKIEKVIKDYNLSSVEDIENILNDISRCISPDELCIVTDLEIEMEYNIHAGNKEYPELFKNSQRISMGQNSVALLLLILNVAHNLGDNRTLLMDQPEDDLDNNYIFNTLVSEFRKSKAIRQIIISTHNANIPVASDSENILVLKYDGQYGCIEVNGSLDNDNIVKEVLNNLEGGSEAIKLRFDKYKLFNEF
ncbi:hypothetical protein [Pelosinus sp. sgz500959]|uniref:hypothetical protein n=1 Tax=Pelosinus sp. sgz500959 TaxID=3242472 RepID=UPI00366C2708